MPPALARSRAKRKRVPTRSFNGQERGGARREIRSSISSCQLVRIPCSIDRAGLLFTFRTTSPFEQMVRIGTPINKPTPQSIVTGSLYFLLPLCSFFDDSVRSVLPPFSALSGPPVSLYPTALPFVVLPRPRKANKPSNSSGILRHSSVASNQQQVPCSYIPASSSFCRANVRTFANYWPVVTCARVPRK